MTWQKGRDTVQMLIGRSELQAMPPSLDQAEAMLADIEKAEGLISVADKVVPKLDAF